MDDFELQTPFDGDVAKALDHVATILSSSGFKITARSDREMGFEGPPMPQGHHEMSRFWGASAVKVSRTSGALRLSVSMGAFDRANVLAMQIGAVLVVLAFGAAGSAAFLAEGSLSSKEAAVLFLGLPLLCFVPVWLIVRLAVKSQEKRIRDSFGVLLNNAAMLAQSR